MAPPIRNLEDAVAFIAQLEQRLLRAEADARAAKAFTDGLSGRPSSPTATISVPHNDTYANQDNVDGSHPLNLDYIIARNALRIVSARLSFKLRPYRTYTSAAAGAAAPHVHYWSAGGTTTIDTTNEMYVTSGGIMHTGPGPGGGVNSVPGGKQTSTEHAVGAVGASVDTAIEAFDGSGHVHAITLTPGVFEGATPTGVTVQFDGVDQTSALGGPFNADVVELDVLSFIASVAGGGWHTISLQPTGPGRIQAYLRLGAYVNGTVH